MRQREGRRGAAALLLAVFLNLALVPCTMALEVVEEGHDCCPPELNLEALECCELDDVSLDTRVASKFDADDVAVVVAQPPLPAPIAARAHESIVDPPDPPDCRPDLNKLYCVFLK
ncbi:MAG: hypothetical protein KJP17_03850 [Gammaproteobacteria bacterium]|nr:hypothetical protein [Gammaproteobacteria bacterium]